MYVSANVAVSLDGRLAPASGTPVALGGRHDLDRMSLRRLEADAVLVGGETFRAWPLPYVASETALRRLRADGDASAPRVDPERSWWNVILTRNGPLATEKDRFWADPRVRPLVLSCAPLVIPRGANLVRARWSPEAVLDALAEQGVERVLIEGGGRLLGPFLAAKCIDTLHVTLCPTVLGGDAGLAGSERWSFEGAPRLRLAACEAAGDEVYLTYERA